MKLTAENISRMILDGQAMMQRAADVKLTDEVVATQLAGLAFATCAKLLGEESTPEQMFAMVLAVRTAFLLGRESNGWG